MPMESANQWDKARGMEITVGAPVKPVKGSWNCNTDLVWPVLKWDKTLATTNGKTPYVCRHMIEAEIKFMSRGNRATGRSKYNAVRTEVDGIKFASKKEANHYEMLKILERAGKITRLTLQPSFPLEVNGQLICRYVADFQYWDVERNEWTHEDVKGWKTPAYKLKKKLMKAIHGIEIKEI